MAPVGGGVSARAADSPPPPQAPLKVEVHLGPKGRRRAPAKGANKALAAGAAQGSWAEAQVLPLEEVGGHVLAAPWGAAQPGGPGWEGGGAYPVSAPGPPIVVKKVHPRARGVWGLPQEAPI